MTPSEPSTGDLSTSGPGAGDLPLDLPVPVRLRWQPLRSGFLNIFRFDHEEFWYEDGRLLLRGSNGTGKSRVLALQLPFLLEGEARPDRMEPDGDPAKRLEWNLLLGKHDDRLGYTWIEFGRLDEYGQAHYLTLGCGIHATAGRSPPPRWFFITRLRPGRDLFLQAPSGQPLTQKALEEALADAGRVIKTASDYRRAVDQELFRLGEHRYQALLDLLVQLRRPQLSRELDEHRLSAALGEALPPVTQGVIDDVAAAFRELQNERDQLAGFAAAKAAADRFDDHYRRYARTAALRRAKAVLTPHRDYDNTQRKLRDAEGKVMTAQAAIADALARMSALETSRCQLEQQIATLKDSPEFRGARDLNLARQALAEREKEARTAESDRETAEGRVRLAETAVAEACKKQEASRSEFDATAEAAALASSGCGLEAAQGEVAEVLAPHLAGPRPDAAVLRTVARDAIAQVRGAVGRRQESARHLKPLVDAAGKAADANQSANQRRDESRAAWETAVESLQAAQRGHERAVLDLIEAYATWRTTLVWLAVPAADDLAEGIESWSEAAAGRGPIAQAVNEAALAATRAIEAEVAATTRRLDEARAQEADLSAERVRLEAGIHRPPPAPYTRDAAGRQTRPGAPLWKLCDFGPGVQAERRAGLEAALEASGLLDAWVTPDGRLLDADEFDTLLVAAGSTALESHLGLVLSPAIDPEDPQAAAVEPGTLTKVLSSVGLGAGSGTCWMDADGSWQVGPLQGRWSKAEAEHIGDGAREASRRRRLAELEAEIGVVQESIRGLEEARRELDRRRQSVEEEAHRAPDDAIIGGFTARRSAAAELERQASDYLAERERQAIAARQAYDAACQTRDDTARDLALEAWVFSLDALREALSQFKACVQDLDHALDRLVLALEAKQQAEVRLEELREDTRTRTGRHEEAATRMAEAQARIEALEATIGKSIQEVLRQLQAAEEGQKQAIEQQKAAKRDHEQAIGEDATAQADARHFSEALDSLAGAREKAIGALRRLAAVKLLAMAAPDLAAASTEDWSVTRAAEIARTLETDLAQAPADDDAWKRLQTILSERHVDLSDELLRRDIPMVAFPEDDLFIIETTFQDRSLSVGELREALAGEIATRQTILSARERAVIENHLLGEVAAHLGERLHEASELVERMNREVARCQTSTGMSLRFRWQVAPDAPVGLVEARKLLMKKGVLWSQADQAALAAYLQQRIEAERMAGLARPWQEILVRALDYRSWHEFYVERHQDGQWKRLDKRTHGTGSGGEKAVALTVPQFAAAAAHYLSADPAAPRLILLDEAFVGVDKKLRSQCLGLIAAFDLDFVMTSENEWGCYAIVPNVSIYQFAAHAGIDAILLTRWVWNGRERRRVEAAPPPAAAIVPQASSNGGQLALLGPADG